MSPDAPRVALVLPGRAYTVDQPVLAYVAATARECGWTIEVVDWNLVGASDEDVIRPGMEALRRLPHTGLVVIGKSLGSTLLPVVSELGLPAVWLTPLLDRETIRAAAFQHTAPALLVGGTADTTWDSGVAHATGHEVLELEGGDHGLVVPDDAEASARFLLALTVRAKAFFASLA